MDNMDKQLAALNAGISIHEKYDRILQEITARYDQSVALELARYKAIEAEALSTYLAEKENATNEEDLKEAQRKHKQTVSVANRNFLHNTDAEDTQQIRERRAAAIARNEEIEELDKKFFAEEDR